MSGREGGNAVPSSSKYRRFFLKSIFYLSISHFLNQDTGVNIEEVEVFYAVEVNMNLIGRMCSANAGAGPGKAIINTCL